MHFFASHFLYFVVGAGSGFVGYAYGAYIKADVMAEYAKLKAAVKTIA